METITCQSDANDFGTVVSLMNIKGLPYKIVFIFKDH